MGTSPGLGALSRRNTILSRQTLRGKSSNGQLLAGTTPVTKPKWRKPGVVTNREAVAIETEDSPETAIGDIGFPPVLDLEIGNVERTLRKSDLPAFIFGYLGTRRHTKIPCRIEGTRIPGLRGLRHGAYCVDCCWVLMTLLFVGGVMNLPWILLLALLVLLEKVTSFGRQIAHLAGVVFVAGGAWLLLMDVSPW